ncbi:MAG: glycosyltransferase [Candidatus Krumholzibacteriia bacterium]
MKRIKVAFVASTLDVGGAENVLFDLATRLPDERYRSAFYFMKSRGVVGARLHAAGHRVAERLQRGRFDLAAPFKLAARLRRFSPDVVLLLDHHNAILWGGLAGMLCGAGKRVIASHATGRMGGRPSFTRSDRAIVATASAVVALSEAHAGYLRDEEGIPASKLVVIENGIDCERYANADDGGGLRRELGIERGERVVTMVAALRPEKAHEALLDAAAGLVETGESLKFLIVGDGERRAVLERRAGKMGLGGRVLFLGEREDVPALLALSDVLVLPSHAAVETLPLAVLEGMAAGVPVVASRVGSLPEVICDGVNGLLIAPADAVGLARAVRDILTHRARTAQMVEKARETVRERYAVEGMVAGYETLFERLATQEEPRQ